MGVFQRNQNTMPILAKLKSFRSLPEALKEVLERIPQTAHPMDVMRTGCSMLGNLEPEGDFSNQNDTADRILASMSSIITYWYRYSHDGVKVDTATDHETIGGQFFISFNRQGAIRGTRKSFGCFFNTLC